MPIIDTEVVPFVNYPYGLSDSLVTISHALFDPLLDRLAFARACTILSTPDDTMARDRLLEIWLRGITLYLNKDRRLGFANLDIDGGQVHRPDGSVWGRERRDFGLAEDILDPDSTPTMSSLPMALVDAEAVALVLSCRPRAYRAGVTVTRINSRGVETVDSVLRVARTLLWMARDDDAFLMQNPISWGTLGQTVVRLYGGDPAQVDAGLDDWRIDAVVEWEKVRQA